MKENSVQIRFKEDPVLLDKILQDMQKSLMNRLKWLNYAFGRAYKLVEHRPDGNKFIYPAMYNGNGEYHCHNILSAGPLYFGMTSVVFMKMKLLCIQKK